MFHQKQNLVNPQNNDATEESTITINDMQNKYIM
jgi:hypothetical protein